ncbi:MAG: trypsin-like serine protease [Proteobacteria bacterium]|nr:trypsin-like serine protease [Pseudomonadota bacterium]
MADERRYIGNFFISLSLYLGFICGCAPTSDPSRVRIYGGSPVALGDLPTAVAVVERESQRLACSGVLITPDVVLTAGHCVQEYAGFSDTLASTPATLADRWKVYVGDGVDGGVLPAQYDVKAVYVHPLLRASPRGYADYGLMVLEHPVVGAEPLPLMAELAPLRSVLLSGRSGLAGRSGRSGSLRIAGFGRREDDGKGIKYQVDVAVRQFSAAEAVVGGAGKDACIGDSGGPAVAIASDGSASLVGTISRGVHLGCGDGAVVSLVSDGACWMSTLVGLQLPQLSQSCPHAPKFYSDAELSLSHFYEICRQEKGNAQQLATVAAIMQQLDARSCASANDLLTSRTELNLDGLMLEDLSPLAGLTQLRRLSLKDNRLTEVSALRHLKELKTLELDGNDIRQFDVLRPLVADGLVIFGRRRQLWNHQDTAFLRQCKLMSEGRADAALTTTIRALFWHAGSDDCVTANGRLLSLVNLDLSGRGIINLEPLADFTRLQSLNLSDNPVQDIAPLVRLERLSQLDLRRSEVSGLNDLSSLVERGLVILR